MKVLTILFLLFANLCFSQENPWESKKGENPWESQEQRKENKPISDSLKINQNIENQGYKLTDANHENQIKELAKTNYKSAGNFGFGFATGLIFNYVAVLPSGIYVGVNSKAEKAVIKELENHPDLKGIDKYKINEVSRKTVKLKKMKSTFLGVITGSLTQIGVLLTIISIS